MFGVRSIVRLGAAALRRLRRPCVRPSCPVPPRPRLSVEPLADRIVPSASLTGLSNLNLSHALSGADTAVRFVEIPASGPWQDHVHSQAPPISSQQLIGALGGASVLARLGTPTVTGGAVEYGGDTVPVLVLQFGSALTIDLAFGANRGGTDLQPGVLGGLVSLYQDGNERRFLIDHGDGALTVLGLPLMLDAFHPLDRFGDGGASSPAPGVPRSGLSGPALSNAAAAPPSAALAAFVAGGPNGRQIADGLAAPTADGTWVNTVEIAVNAGNPADVLLAVDTVLPDASPDLIRLKGADLAVVPTYLIGDAVAAPSAPGRADDQPDLGLIARVVGLDELPVGVPPAPVSVEQLLGLLGAEGTPGAPAVETEVRDAGFALGEWFEGALNRGGSGAVVAALVLEGALVAYVYRRSRRVGIAIRVAQVRPDRPGEKG